MSVTIREQSDQLKAAAAGQLPAEVVEVFDRSIERLLNEGVPSDAVRVGDRLDPFTLDDATGAPVSLEQLVESGPAVIVFYRGGWCPYCNLALRTYQRDLVPQLNGFDARLVAISPQSPDESLSTAEKADLSFTILSDPGSRLAGQIGIASSRPTRCWPLSASSVSTWPKSTPKAPSAYPDRPCWSWTATGWCASSTSNPTTRPEPRSPTSSPRWPP